MNRLDLHVLGKQDIDTVAAQWRILEAQIDPAGLTTSWEWTATWLKNYGDTIDYWFVVGTEKNVPVGIALLTKETQRQIPFPIAAYHIGTEGEPYGDMVRAVNNRILVKDSSKIAFYKKLFELIQDKFPWEELVFDNFSAMEAQIIERILKHTNYALSVDTKPSLSYDFTEARAKNASVLETLSSETRYTIRRSLKVFNNDITTEWAETPEQAFSILDELITLYNVTWKKLGKRSVFDSSRFLNFQRAIILLLLKRKQVILFRVKSKEYGTLGCLYLLVDKGIGYGYQLGLNHFENRTFKTINKKRLRTGFIVHTLCMEECLRRGLKGYNFSEGLHSYKKELTNMQESFVTVSVKKSIKPIIRNHLFSLHNKMSEKKQTPLLFQIIIKTLYKFTRIQL